MKAAEDIIKAIPDPQYRGLVIIDYEAWRPAWHLNWGRKQVYKNESLRDVMSRFPGLSRKAAREKAMIEFNKQAK